MRDNYWQNIYALPQYAPMIRTAIDHEVRAAQSGPQRFDPTIEHWLNTLQKRLGIS